MGLFSKSKQGFLGATQHTLAEVQQLGKAAAHAATETLRKLTQQDIHIDDTNVYLLPRDRLGAVLGAHKGAHVGARFPVNGPAPGTVATVFQKQDALELVALLLGREKGSIKRIGALEESAIAEMTNISLNGAITQLATMGGVRFDTGVPDVASPVKDVEIFLGMDAPPELDHAVVLETRFTEPTRGITGHLVMVFGTRGQRVE